MCEGKVRSETTKPKTARKITSVAEKANRKKRNCKYKMSGRYIIKAMRAENPCK
jgi:hypothetical protein